jgi:hypothetical protein
MLCLATLPQERELVLIVHGTGWVQGLVWTGAEGLAPPSAFNSRTVQPVASLCTDYTILAHNYTENSLTKHKSWSKSIQDVAVKLIILKVPWWQTKSPSAWTCLFQGLFHSSTNCILGHLEKLMCHVKFYHFHILKLFSFQGVLHSAEDGELTWAHVWRVWGLRHLCCVWIQIAAQVVPSAPLHYDYEFAMHHLPIFFNHHRDIVVLIKPLVYSLAMWNVIMVHHASWTQSIYFLIRPSSSCNCSKGTGWLYHGLCQWIRL